jgi:hypothetical protein
MRVKNTKLSSRTVAAICILVTLSMLLMSAGCVDSAPKNSPEVPASTCSVDTGVCPVPIPGTVRIDASPQMYSPTMSSTIGIGLTPNVSGFNTTDAQFEWNATYGQFLDWSAPNNTVSRLSQPIVNHGEKIFWSFTDGPASPPVPVIITITARDVQSQKVLGTSRLTLGWKDSITVIVEKTE